jgi:Spy/CpxP family protein refolding chaperone
MMRVYTAASILVVCVLLTGLAAPGLSRAGSSRSPREPGLLSDRFIAEHAQRLGLDEQTLAAIRTIVDASHERGRALQGELHRAHNHMRALLSQETPDEAAVMQQAEAIGALELAERQNRLQAMLRIRALLTPEQRQELIRLGGESQMRRKPDVISACRTELTSLCPDATHEQAWRQCLHAHTEELSAACRAAIQHRRGGGRPRP